MSQSQEEVRKRFRPMFQERRADENSDLVTSSAFAGSDHRDARSS